MNCKSEHEFISIWFVLFGFNYSMHSNWHGLIFVYNMMVHVNPALYENLVCFGFSYFNYTHFTSYNFFVWDFSKVWFISRFKLDFVSHIFMFLINHHCKNMPCKPRETTPPKQRQQTVSRRLIDFNAYKNYRIMCLVFCTMSC